MKKKNIVIYVPSDDYSQRELIGINFFEEILKKYNCNFIFPKNKNNFKYKIKNIKFTKKRKWREILWNISQALAANLFKKQYLSKPLHHTIYKYNMNIEKKKIFYFLNLFKFLNFNKFIIFLSKFILKNTVDKNIFKYKNVNKLIIFGGHSILDAHDLIICSKNMNIKSILIMINWDNATKPLFAKPDLVLTWVNKHHY